MSEAHFNTSSDSVVWRTAGGDNPRRGLYPRALNIERKPFRRLSARGAVHASVVFDRQGRAFVADRAGHVQAFSSEGKLIWGATLEGGVTATPVVHPADPLVFVGTHLGKVCALETASGAIRWQEDIPTKSDPRILSDLLHHPATDTVVFSSWGGRFRALDARTGNERFSWDAGISPDAAAASGRNGDLFCLRAVSDKGVEFVQVTNNGGETVLLTEPEGKRGARRTLVSAAPVIDEDRGVAYFVVNTDTTGVLHAWSIKSGRLLWSHRLEMTVQATPTLSSDDTIVVADLAGEIHGVSADGTELWRYSSGAEYLLAAGAMETGGTFFVGDPLGRLHVVNARGKGKTVFEAPRSIEARPSFSPSGDLYLPCTDRTVYVFRAR
jgi:outer membrane protein assembly factor BamB